MKTGVDSSILLDVLKPDPQFAGKSLYALRRAYDARVKFDSIAERTAELAGTIAIIDPTK